MSDKESLAEKLPGPAIINMADADLLDLQSELGKSMGRLTSQLQRMRSNLTRVKNELKLRREGGRARQEVLVSDHAVIRYLERHKGLDITGIRDEIREIAKRAKHERMEKRHGERLTDEASGMTMIYSQERNSIATVLSNEAKEVLDA